jgi:hypothetical protein
MAGLHGLSGPRALPHVAMEFSSVGAPVTASTIAVKAPLSRHGPATSRSVTRDVSVLAT